MGNNIKNSKQTESKQKSLLKNASDQQKNQTKMRTDPNNSILMSKQLMQKKSSSNSRRLKRKARSLPNAKPMPSLADLEKMFEDSDDEVEDQKSTDAKQQPAPKHSAYTTSNTTKTPMVPKVMVTDVLLSSTAVIEIEEPVKEKLNTSYNSPNDIEITSPSRKRIKSYEQSDEFNDLPPINISSEKKSVTENIVFQNKTKQPTVPVEPKGKTQKLIPYDENDDGLDKFQSKSVSETFSPIPSTSQSTEVFNRNEDLYLESLTEYNNNLTEEQPVQKQIPEPHNDTIVIEDELMEDPLTDVKIEIQNDIQIIDSTNQISPIVGAETINSQNSCEDDDDCIIIETPTTIHNRTNESNIIDIEVVNVENQRNSTVNANGEIIDVDAIIAHNQSINDKYKTKSDPLNLVVDVDISTVTQGVNIPSRPTTNTNQSETPEKITISVNVQNQPNNDHDSNTHNQNSSEQKGDESFVFRNIRMNEDRYNNLMAIQAIHDSSPLSVSDLLSPFPFLTEPLMEMVRNSPGGEQNIHRHRLVPTAPGSGGYYPTTSSSSSSFETYFPPSNMRARYFGMLAAVLKQRTERRTRAQNHIDTSFNNEQRSSNVDAANNDDTDDSDAGECHSKLTHSLGDCPICMEKLRGKVIGSTICGHVFCMSCLKRAVKTNKRCPTCRKVLKYNGYHKIFL